MATESYVLNVLEVIAETDDASSVVFEVPDELAEEFTYTPGQFLTVAVPSDETGLAARCYSLSSAPHSGRHQITVKRTADGYASNWINDNLQAGDTLRVLPPSGIFTPKDFDADLLLFAGGSGITPVMSIVRTALEKGSGRVVLLYANRDERSVIFAGELGELATEYADRFTLVHWLESVQGLPTQRHLQLFASYFDEFTAFTCGPAPYMAAVTDALKELGFPRERRHVEKFVSLGGNPFGDVEEVRAVQEQLRDADDHEPEDDSDEDDTADDTPRIEGPISVEVELDGEQYSFDDWQGDKVLLEFLEE
jgi:3-ketosteroid 9alpha-monooxygenase subunit B